MSTIDKRCGTCRFYGATHSGLCGYLVPGNLPLWVKDALGCADKDVEADESTDCDAWEAKQ